MKYVKRSAITVYGTEAFLEWVKRQCPELHYMTLENLNFHPSVYLVDGEDQNCWGDCFEANHKAIFENEVGHYVSVEEDMPKGSRELFLQWFDFEYHEVVVDLSESPLEFCK